MGKSNFLKVCKLASPVVWANCVTVCYSEWEWRCGDWRHHRWFPIRQDESRGDQFEERKPPSPRELSSCQTPIPHLDGLSANLVVYWSWIVLRVCHKPMSSARERNLDAILLKKQFPVQPCAEAENHWDKSPSLLVGRAVTSCTISWTRSWQSFRVLGTHLDRTWPLGGLGRVASRERRSRVSLRLATTSLP